MGPKSVLIGARNIFGVSSTKAEQALTNAYAQESANDCESVHAPARAETYQVTSSEQLRHLLRGYRQRALGFVSTQSHRARLVIISAVLLEQQRLMSDVLQVAGPGWDLREACAAAFSQNHGQPRAPKWRTLLAGTQALDGAFLQRLSALLRDCDNWAALQLRDYTVSNSALAFRLIGIAGATCYQSLVVPHRGYPWKAFGLAAGVLEGSFADTLKQERNCMFDLWTQQFVDKYEDKLHSDEARADCLSTALLLHTDTSDIERKHASIRRRVVVASAQTHAQHLSAASSEFVFRQASGSEVQAPGPTSAMGRKRCEKPEMEPEDKQAAKRGGGGPYRAFIHHRYAGQVGRIDWAAMRVEYKALSPEQRAQYEEWGRHATIAHRRGGRAFGPTVRETQRARARQNRQQQVAVAQELGREALLRSFAGSSADGGLEVALRGVAPTALARRSAGSWNEIVESSQKAIRLQGQQRHAMDSELANARLAICAKLMESETGQALVACMAPDAGSRDLTPEVSGVSLLRLWRWKPHDTLDKAARALCLRRELPVGRALMEALDSGWEQRHTMVCSEDAPKIGLVPQRQSKCCLEGVCLCSDEGRSTRFMMLRLNQTMSAAFRTVEEKGWLTNAFVGVLLTGTAAEPSPTPSDAGVGMPSAAEPRPQVFLHIALHALSPFRPTYMAMEIVSLKGASASCRATGEWQTQAQALSTLDKSLRWTVRTFRLVESEAPVARFLPEAQLYIERVPMDSEPVFWRGEADELKGRSMTKWPGDATEPSAEQPEGQHSPEDAEDPDASESDNQGAGDDSGSETMDDPFMASDDDVGDFHPGSDARGPLGSALPADAAEGDSKEGSQAAEPSQADGGAAPGRRRRPAPESVLQVAVPGGEIRFYPMTQRFVAHCEHAGHGTCRREKLSHHGRNAAQGRPLGYLAAWLLDCEYPDHVQHLACTNILSQEARLEGREGLKGALGSDHELFLKERARRDGEPEEPTDCP